MKTLTRLGVVGLLFASFLSSAALAANADCVRDGKSYPHGTVLGGYVCIDGTWKKL